MVMGHFYLPSGLKCLDCELSVTQTPFRPTSRVIFQMVENSEELVCEETQKDTAKSRQIKDRGSTANSNISEFSLNAHIALHTEVIA